jgi:hypothetical protein
MGQGRLTQTGRPVEQNVVERFAPALGGSDGNVQILFDLCLSVEILKTAGAQAGIERRVFGIGFTRNNTSDFPCLLRFFGNSLF